MSKQGTQEYCREIRRLREKYRDQITIRLGIEQDIFSEVDRQDFDFIIGVSKFTSDNGDYVIGKDASSSQLKIHTPYTVQWLNENNDILETDNDVAEGEIPTYDGEAPTKPNDTQAMYVFDEWSPEVVAATGNVSYTATYKETTPVAKVDDTLFGSITNAVKAETGLREAL